MRNSALITSATLALLLVPVPSTAQELPQWLFEVPLNLQALNQEVESVHVNCYVSDQPVQDIGQDAGVESWIGIGSSARIYPDGQGNVSGVASVETWSAEPEKATHYVCQLHLTIVGGGGGPPNSSPIYTIGLQPKSGTQLVSEVAGSLP